MKYSCDFLVLAEETQPVLWIKHIFWSNWPCQLAAQEALNPPLHCYELSSAGGKTALGAELFPVPTQDFVLAKNTPPCDACFWDKHHLGCLSQGSSGIIESLRLEESTKSNPTHPTLAMAWRWKVGWRNKAGGLAVLGHHWAAGAQLWGKGRWFRFVHYQKNMCRGRGKEKSSRFLLG